jgi:hypothetical protein
MAGVVLVVARPLETTRNICVSCAGNDRLGMTWRMEDRLLSLGIPKQEQGTLPRGTTSDCKPVQGSLQD